MNSDSSERNDTTDVDSLTESQRSAISFGTIEVREHAMILGKGLSVSGTGPSLEIDWEPQANTIIGLDEYEAMRYDRRQKNELIMPGSYRRNLLLESGYTMREITEMAEEEKRTGRAQKAMKKLSKLIPGNKK